MGASGYGFSYSLALMGAGHLVGLSVGMAMLLGIAIGWAACMPILTAMAQQHAPLADFVTIVWRTQLRFIGAGAMGVAAIMVAAAHHRPHHRRAGRDGEKPQQHDRGR